MFEEGTTKKVCVISKELSIYNDLSVGDTIVITNPIYSSESYKLKITGIYESSSNNEFTMSRFGKEQDPANQIYMSANALQEILDASKKNSKMVEDEQTGTEKESKIIGSTQATYLFKDIESYNNFEIEVKDLGLPEEYVVSSSDLQEFENSIEPLNTLSTMAGWFLIVILIIGGVILVVLNIFNVRERKYEVGVLTAMGMKKRKVALQFLCETLVVTMLAVILGAGIGAVSSVPVTNALLKEQIESQSTRSSKMEENFGRPQNFMNEPPTQNQNSQENTTPTEQNIQKGGMFGDFVNKTTNYISKVDSAMNLTVVLQLLGIGIILTIVASMGSVLFIMRYDPLKILANRD